MAAILIDTEVFKGHHFDFDKEDFEILERLVEKGRVNVLISTVIDREVMEDITERSAAAQRAIRKTLKEHSDLQHHPQSHFHELVKNGALADLTSIRLQQWQDWKDNNEVDVLGIETVDSEEVFADYFGNKPPFAAGKKKFEFPDAFTLSAAKKWCVKNGESVTVVSKDGDLEKYCKAHPNYFELAKTLAEALEQFSDEAVVEKIRDAFDDMNGDLIERLGKEFESSEFTAYEHDGEVEGAEVHSVHIEDIHIALAEEGSGVAELQVRFVYTATVDYDDPSSGIYDSEDKVMLFMERTGRHVEETSTQTVTVEFTYDSANPSDVTVDKINLETYSQDIDVNDHLY